MRVLSILLLLLCLVPHAPPLHLTAFGFATPGAGLGFQSREVGEGASLRLRDGYALRRHGSCAHDVYLEWSGCRLEFVLRGEFGIRVIEAVHM